MDIQNGLCITDAVKQFGVTSKTLRYYERVGLLEAKRADSNNYRYYDDPEVERIRQIMILRKMQISIKDIIRIYENEDMSTVVEVFVSRINAINGEIDALSELKRITNEFLQVMLQNGITKISALPILYERMEKQLDIFDSRKTMNYSELSVLSEKFSKPVNPSILYLPPMRALSSVRKDGVSDPDGFWLWVQTNAVPPGEPGHHERFELQPNSGEGGAQNIGGDNLNNSDSSEYGDNSIFIIKVADDFINDGEYIDYIFPGGLYAAADFYLDDDLGACFRSLIKEFDANKYYQIDYNGDGNPPGYHGDGNPLNYHGDGNPLNYHGDGNPRRAAMLESLVSSDDQRELLSLLAPVKKRLADPALFEKPREATGISLAEIEAANPALWTEDVQLDKLTPINSPHYQMTDQGEAEYIAWISTRVLSTNVEVKLPFRVDAEFRIRKESMQFAWGADEGNIRIYHGGDLNYLFGVNMETNPDERLSQEAVCFHQPIFRDYFQFPKRGRVNRNEYNRLTWIVGEKHLAVAINGEVRYCGVNFPYMSVNWNNQAPLPIIIGSNGQSKIFFKSIRVSQLAVTRMSRIKKGELAMVTKKSNNIVPNIHRFITSEFGENYHFNGCARYVMESLGECAVGADLNDDEVYGCKKASADFGYWFFTGLTGDILAQVYSYNDYLGESVSAYMLNCEGGGYFERLFDKCGYASTFVPGKQLAANKEMYVQTLTAYIDKGVPVIAVTHGGPPWGVYVGYEEYGKTLLYLAGDKSEPERVPIEKIIVGGVDYPHHVHASSDEIHIAKGWIFVGEKKRAVGAAQIYRDIVLGMPGLLTAKTDKYCFGAEAFRAWAADIENGRFDGVKPEDFDGWGAHVSNVCNMATNGSCVMNFTCRAQALNPDMTFLNEEINKLYDRTAHIWNNDGGCDLEALGGGFNVTLEALQDKERRAKIAAKLREAAGCIDEVVNIIQKFSKEQTIPWGRTIS